MGQGDYISVAVVVKPHGLKGDVVVKPHVNYQLQFEKFSVLYVNQAGSLVPNTIESSAKLNKGLVKIKFAGADDQSAAQGLRGVELLLPSSDLDIDKQVDLVGFALVDRSQGKIGTVISVLENTAQTLLEVGVDGDEIYIPFVNEFVLNIDHSQRVIEMDLPDGILDL